MTTWEPGTCCKTLSISMCSQNSVFCEVSNRCQPKAENIWSESDVFFLKRCVRANICQPISPCSLWQDPQKKTLGTVTITTVFPWTSGHPDSPPLMVFRESEPSSPAECWWHEPCEDLALYSFRQRERERHVWYTGTRYIYVYLMCIYMCIYIYPSICVCIYIYM